MKIIAAVFGIIMLVAFGASAQEYVEDCDCGSNPYVAYELSHPVEMDENPWRVMSVERFDHDLTQEEEPEVCVVKLELIPHTEAILYEDIPAVQQQELYWGDRWIPIGEFENQMDASGCSIEGAQS